LGTLFSSLTDHGAGAAVANQNDGLIFPIQVPADAVGPSLQRDLLDGCAVAAEARQIWSRRAFSGHP